MSDQKIVHRRGPYSRWPLLLLMLLLLVNNIFLSLSLSFCYILILLTFFCALFLSLPHKWILECFHFCGAIRAVRFTQQKTKIACVFLLFSFAWPAESSHSRQRDLVQRRHDSFFFCCGPFLWWHPRCPPLSWPCRPHINVSTFLCPAIRFVGRNLCDTSQHFCPRHTKSSGKAIGTFLYIVTPLFSCSSCFMFPIITVIVSFHISHFNENLV